jgi:predicted ATPase
VGVRDEGGWSLQDSLVGVLRARQLLLVLDNFEQVVTAAPLVADLLTKCPGLRALTTSRVALRVQGEQLFPLEPLALPDPSQQPTVGGAAPSSAVALFMQRAQAVKSDFVLTPANVAAVVAICRRLDGLPLALELAAARVPVLPPQAMLARLGTSLAVLTNGARDLPARLQTLRGAIDWSYGLLEQHEQLLLRRLAVFMGGCTLDAADAVCNTDGALDVLGTVASLVDKSLLRMEERPAGELRVAMLETIREYGLERLAACGEADGLRRGHAAYFLALAEAVEPEGAWSREGAELARLERDHDNLRAALGWALEHSAAAERGLRPGEALERYRHMHGHLCEGRAWVERQLAVNDHITAASAAAARATALAAAAWAAQSRTIFRGRPHCLRRAWPCVGRLDRWRA